MKKTYEELRAELMQKVLDEHDDLVRWATVYDHSQKRIYELQIGDSKITVHSERK